MNEGNVYVFNTTSWDVSLFLDNHPLAEIGGVSHGTDYVPQFIAVLRSPLPEPAGPEFAEHNLLVAAFAGQEPFAMTIDIDPNQVPLNEDLQLYLALDNCLLVELGGRGVPISAVAGSDEQADSDEQAAPWEQDI